ncbi:MAG: iron-containing alcohol dehydrogenase [Syntrophaceae bacterium]|nr:iron-containing alcohol dehydrogenase [Syntrophaceae bacterium]
MTQIIFERAHPFYSPLKILFGPNAIKALGGEARTLGVKKALIVTDLGVLKADLLGPVKESLESAGIAYVIHDQVEPEPPIRCVDAATAQFKSEGCDLVIGIGGGSCLDVAKGVSVMATNTGGVLDYCGIDLVRKQGAKKILIPTTSGTGSEVTRVFVVTDETDHTKKVVNSLYALADIAIVDPLLTLTMPPKITADTGMDALVHAIETYVSIGATPFSDILAERPIQWIAQYLPIAWAKGSNLEARYFMSLAATTAGLAFASGGLGAVHALAYPIGTGYHLSHGRANSVMLPHVMRYNLPGNPEKYAAIASLMGKEIEGLSDPEAALLAVEAVEELLTTLQIPFHLHEYGIPKEGLPRLVEGAMKFSRLFIPNPRDLKEEDVFSIYEQAY